MVPLRAPSFVRARCERSCAAARARSRLRAREAAEPRALLTGCLPRAGGVPSASPPRFGRLRLRRASRRLSLRPCRAPDRGRFASMTRGLVYAEAGARPCGRGDHARRARAERGAGAGRGVRCLPHRSPRRRDRRVGHEVPDPARSRGCGRRRRGWRRRRIARARRPCRDRLACAVRRRVPCVQARRSAAVLEQSAREAPSCIALPTARC